MERPLTVQEAAALLGYHPDHVRRLIRSGIVNGERVGIGWLIPLQEVERIKAMQGKGGRLPKVRKQ
jgi:excisionase family DNA binding protein